MKRNFYIFIIFFVSRQFAAQTFVSDWTSFSNKKWTVIFNQIPTSPFVDKKTKGQIVFKNKKDKSLELTFEIYAKLDHDTILKKAIHDWYFVQSCSNMTKDGKSFSEFEFKNYYYYLKPCHNCHTALSTDCYQLADQLAKYILTK